MTTSFDTTMANLGISRTGAKTGADTSKLGSQNMDQSSFLTLMTAQMKNQDPFDPVDNTQMVAQMAQFSSLAGISEMNTTLQAIAAKLTGTSMGEAINYVGKTVLVEGSTAYPRTSGGLSGAVNLDGDAREVKVTIQGKNGETLRTLNLGRQAEGAVAFDWDGVTDSGEPAGEGPFTVKVSAQNAKGGAVQANPLVWAPVSSVSRGADQQPVLELPGIGQVPLSAVWQVG
ncbi:flagellar hook assembly protein FlgD [Sphingomonas turrisvirgatae]|uniref:Basal-body rod modification protein FlgD n=1 Tax=Sphingomonas turrisvirgatae TaxID=1888892 RepID=A0A1E3M1W6_9SPHN|nr:flagellar hook capping FlgD N-terminal domain-containing protein [Sphingomonas turrisvirgatae]ODP39050.1 flagellar hook capping protein [Sphingomonas turrisvirgatae]